MEVKLCKDCKWIVWPIDPKDFPEAEVTIKPGYKIITEPVCSHENARPSFVTGQPTSLCEDMRNYGGAAAIFCGPEGKWWEAK